MGWRSILFGFAAVAAFCLGAWAAPAGDARRITAFQLPTRSAEPAVPRGPEGMDGQPRCVAPPPSEDLIERSPAIGTGAPWRERMVIAGLRPSEDGMHRLYPGDTVHLTVFNDPNLSGDFSIDARGFVRLPLVGQVAAAGLTTSRLESRIADAFINGGFLSDPRIVVDVVNDRPLYIVGEIAEPGDTGTRVILTSP